MRELHPDFYFQMPFFPDGKDKCPKCKHISAGTANPTEEEKKKFYPFYGEALRVFICGKCVSRFIGVYCGFMKSGVL